MEDDGTSVNGYITDTPENPRAAFASFQAPPGSSQAQALYWLQLAHFHEHTAVYYRQQWELYTHKIVDEMNAEASSRTGSV